MGGRFRRDTAGAVSIEYVFIIGFVSILIVGALKIIGPNLNSRYFAPVAASLS